RIAVRARVAERRRLRERRSDHVQAADPSDEVSGRELCAILDEELMRLPDRCRRPLVLCYLEGRTRDEAAEALGWSLGTLKRRLEEGRERLRGRLTRRGLTLSGTLLAVALVEGAATAAPAALTTATGHGALPFAAGAAEGISPRAAALAEGALRTMMTTKLKLTAAL